MELTKRIAINVGLKCNLKCKFCYYSDSHNQKKPSLEELKKQLKKAKKYGITSIEITGGEPTLREDIHKLIQYAKLQKFKRIGIITNGILLKDADLVKKLKSAGLDEIKISIHSSKPEIYDKICNTKNKFKDVLEGIKNVKKNKIKIKTNTIISKFNYKDLPEIGRFLTTLNPTRVNFKIVTPILDSQKLNKNILAPYSKIAPYLHRTLDMLTKEGYDVTVRYMPFCFMEGYEKYVCNLNQVQYDPDEWDYLIKNKIEYGKVLTYLNLLIGCLNMLKDKNFPKKDVMHRVVIAAKLARYTTKSERCKECKYDLICDGLWKKYAQIYGYNEIISRKGEKIKDPTFFLSKK